MLYFRTVEVVHLGVAAGSGATTMFSQRKGMAARFGSHKTLDAYAPGLQDGDPYRDEMEQCVGLIMEQLAQRGLHNRFSLAYQSRVGPVGFPAALL